MPVNENVDYAANIIDFGDADWTPRVVSLQDLTFGFEIVCDSSVYDSG